MKVIIMCGCPGSGKSTFASKHPSYIRINQDTLGDRQKCLELFRKAMKDRRSVIIDRCNINKMQRAIWVREAEKFGVTEINAVYLSVDPETCIERINSRKDHPTIKANDTEKNKEIVYNFVKTFEMPELSEGFDKVLIIDNE